MGNSTSSTFRESKTAAEMAPEILQVCHIAPPPGSAQPTTLPLTCFDLLWLTIPLSTQLVFLYHIPGCTTASFLDSHLPRLSHSLSLALKRFFPLAGRLVRDYPKPYIRYSDGDSVALTVAESHDDLRELTSDQPKEAVRVQSLVPGPIPCSGNDQPVAALQITIFPDQGIAVGITAIHAAMDGPSFLHFARTWASICQSGDDGAIPEDPPFYDRSVIPDSENLRGPYISKLRTMAEMGSSTTAVREQPALVRATFTLTVAELDGLRRWVSSRAPDGKRYSSLALAVALVWTSLLKAGLRSPGEVETLIIPVECRPRIEPPVPASYFGNCVSGCFVTLEREGLLGEEGLAAAAEAILKNIKGLQVEGGLQVKLETMFAECRRMVPLQPMSIVGSPRLGFYKVDFGWGRPSKCEVVSIDGNKAVSLLESRAEAEEAGSLEIGMAFPASLMERFADHFHATLNTCLVD